MRLIDADALKEAVKNYANEPVKLKDRRWDTRCRAIIADMQGMIDFSPTVSGWISVKDRVPEKHLINDHEADVLLYIPKRDECRQHGIYLGFLRETPMPPDDGSGNFWGRPCPGSDWTVWGRSHFEEPIVTHWMPLPEPPKE